MGFSMKAVLIVHNAVIDTEVNEMLKSVGIECYTKFPNALGRGSLSEPHLDTEVWPGVNCGTLVVVADDRARAAMDAVRQLRETLGSEGIKAFLWPIEEIT
jgi:nitrogen regulatory protein PII